MIYPSGLSKKELLRYKKKEARLRKQMPKSKVGDMQWFVDNMKRNVKLEDEKLKKILKKEKQAKELEKSKKKQSRELDNAYLKGVMGLSNKEINYLGTDKPLH